MKATIPNYTELGFSDSMGPNLRKLIETQLLSDLKNYGIHNTHNLKFDWSDSCVEGHSTQHLDGRLENYSGISVFDDKNKLVAAGWMDFIKEKDFFLAYWDDVTTFDGDTMLQEKKWHGIPEHILRVIPT